MNLTHKLKRKKPVKWYDRERIPALDNALRDAVYQNHKLEGYLNKSIIPLSEYFLGCGFHEFYSLNVMYPMEVDLFLLPLLEKILNENFICHNSEVAEHLRSVIGTENFDRLWGHKQKHIGLNHKFYIASNGEFTSLLSSGNYFMEDHNGTRIVLEITSAPGGARNFFGSDQLAFTISTNSKTSGVEEACAGIIRTVNRQLNRELRDSAYAMGGNGMPIKIGRLSWDDLKITDDLKRDIRFHISDFITRIDRFKEAGLKPSRGIIVAGPPGNGKTMLGKILCSNLDVPFFFAAPGDFKFGSGKVKIEDLYRTASLYAPAIVFIEDADIFLQNRDYTFSGHVLSSFLNLIDGLNENTGIITILTCNTPELIDEAIKNRPKRFDVIIEFPNPAHNQRMEILSARLGKHLDAADLEYLSTKAGEMEGFSGAHLVEFADRLIMSKIYSDSQFITREMISSGLEQFTFRPSTEKTIGIR